VGDNDGILMHFDMVLLYHKGKETFSTGREVSTHDL